MMLSSRLDAKDVPKLPKAQNLKGKIFDDWLIAFKVKLKQAGCTEIVDPDYQPPEES